MLYVGLNIQKQLIWESNDVKLLGITIDRDLKFDKHVLKLCAGKGITKMLVFFLVSDFFHNYNNYNANVIIFKFQLLPNVSTPPNVPFNVLLLPT